MDCFINSGAPGNGFSVEMGLHCAFKSISPSAFHLQTSFLQYDIFFIIRAKAYDKIVTSIRHKMLTLHFYRLNGV